MSNRQVAIEFILLFLLLFNFLWYLDKLERIAANPVGLHAKNWHQTTSSKAVCFKKADISELLSNVRISMSLISYSKIRLFSLSLVNNH